MGHPQLRWPNLIRKRKRSPKSHHLKHTRPHSLFVELERTPKLAHMPKIQIQTTRPKDWIGFASRHPQSQTFECHRRVGNIHSIWHIATAAGKCTTWLRIEWWSRWRKHNLIRRPVEIFRVREDDTEKTWQVFWVLDLTHTFPSLLPRWEGGHIFNLLWESIIILKRIVFPSWL